MAKTSIQGLSTEEAKQRLQSFGPNEILGSTLGTRWSEIKKVLADPMGLMLLGLALLYAIIGSTVDATILLIAYIPVTAVDVLLEIRAQRALKALQQTLKSTAKLLRDGKVREIPTREIVPGDIVVFEEGQSLPADGRVIEADYLLVNESALTGESIPQAKQNSSPFFGGTFVIKGRGLGEITTTGKKTRFGEIATLLESTGSEETPLQKKVHRIVKRVIVAALFLAIGLFALAWLRTGNVLHSLILALTFGMAAVPEEFPLVFTLYLSLGAWRLSKHGVLVKSLPSVEALGSVDLICTDKTGTLTEGRFQLESIEAIGNLDANEKIEPIKPKEPVQPLPPLETREHLIHNDQSNSLSAEQKLWLAALMACEEKIVDPMEVAIAEKARPYFELLKDWQLRWDYPFEAVGKLMSHVWQNNSSGQTIIAMKGSIEGVIQHCSLTPEQSEQVHRRVLELAGQGKRLLALASREKVCVGDRQQDESDLKLLGLMIFEDPIRQSAFDSIQKCQNAGITVKMLTGDHPLTAHAVADQLGIEHNHRDLFSGDQLLAMSKDERWEAYRRGVIFSRVLPEQKFEMIQAFKADGRIVAMTGDGINDAPALKLADIGISMGAHATDVARSTAQMILTKNDFNGISEAVLEGRRIFANLQRSFSYLISFHCPVILLTLVPTILGWHELLLPIHIVLLELIVHPISAFAFENLPGKDTIKNKSGILSKSHFFTAGLSGLLLSLSSLYLFFTTMNEKTPLGSGVEGPNIVDATLSTSTIEAAAVNSHGVEIARTVAMATILLGNIFFVVVDAWPALTKRLFITIFCLCILIALVFNVESITTLFHWQSLPWPLMGKALILALLSSLPTLIIREKQRTQ